MELQAAHAHVQPGRSLVTQMLRIDAGLGVRFQPVVDVAPRLADLASTGKSGE